MNLKLTPKQKKVFDLATEGLTNKEIARKLDVEPETVKTHVRAVIKKTGTRRGAWWKLKHQEEVAA